MKTNHPILVPKHLPLFLTILFISVLSLNGFSQIKQCITFKMKIDGTSTLHDWDMTSTSGILSANVVLSGNTIKNINTIIYTVNAESFKSGENKLDRTAYKAMKATQFPSISFVAPSATVKGNQITADGKLTIAGVTKPITLIASATVATDKSIIISGSYKLKMTEYNIVPPSFALGAMKTGDAITLTYSGTVK